MFKKVLYGKDEVIAPITAIVKSEKTNKKILQ
jgi:hypothetical protein